MPLMAMPIRVIQMITGRTASEKSQMMLMATGIMMVSRNGMGDNQMNAVCIFFVFVI